MKEVKAGELEAGSGAATNRPSSELSSRCIYEVPPHPLYDSGHLALPDRQLAGHLSLSASQAPPPRPPTPIGADIRSKDSLRGLVASARKGTRETRNEQMHVRSDDYRRERL
jgi:hypothetical protein